MTDPILFPSQSPRFGLPLLLVGQAQKEAFVNEAHALTDALLHCAIEGEAAAPPSSPSDGTAWLVSTNATGAWLGKAGLIACRQGGNWLFVAPRDGIQILDRSTGQMRHYKGSWRRASGVAEPIGGTVVDSAARTAIVGLINALRDAGIFPES